MTQLKTEKDQEIQQLHDKAKETQVTYSDSVGLEQELKCTALQTELDRHQALDTLREAPKSARERAEGCRAKKAHTERLIQDLQSRFE